VRQLRSDVDTSVASRRRRSVPVQRVWSLPEDERTEPAARQAQTTTGRSYIISTDRPP